MESCGFKVENVSKTNKLQLKISINLAMLFSYWTINLVRNKQNIKCVSYLKHQSLPKRSRK